MNKKSVLITGSSSGLGLALSMQLAKLGYYVYAGTRNPARLKGHLKACDCNQSNLQVVDLDIKKEKSIKKIVKKIIDERKGVDILINNAACVLVGAIENIKIGSLKKILDINLLGVVRCIKEVLPAMRRQKGGLIINISSVSGVVGSQFLGGYCASKFGLEGLSESLATELSRCNIRVVLVEPGILSSDFIKNTTIENNSGAGNYYYENVKNYINSISDLYNLGKAEDPQIAAEIIIKQVIFENKNKFRYQTSNWAKKMVGLKLRDNDLLNKSN